MKTLSLFAAIALLTLSACDTRDIEAVATRAGDSAAVDAIAGDKRQIEQVLREAHAKGTFDDAMAAVLRDSAMAAEIHAMLRDDPRFAVARDTAAPPRAASSTSGAAPRAKGVRASSTKPSTAAKGDALDRTERTVRDANEKLDQAARVKRDVEEARKKVEGILGGK
jgi:hypothetical protein